MKRLLLFAMIAFVAVACVPRSDKLRELKFKPEMQQIASKYYEELDPEIFATTPAWSKFDTIETYKVIVTIVNAKKLPKEYSEVNQIAKQIAKDVYCQLENKTDYSMIEVIFRNKKGVAMANFQMNRNFPFKYEELLKEDEIED